MSMMRSAVTILHFGLTTGCPRARPDRRRQTPVPASPGAYRCWLLLLPSAVVLGLPVRARGTMCTLSSSSRKGDFELPNVKKVIGGGGAAAAAVAVANGIRCCMVRISDPSTPSLSLWVWFRVVQHPLDDAFSFHLTFYFQRPNHIDIHTHPHTSTHFWAHPITHISARPPPLPTSLNPVSTPVYQSLSPRTRRAS